MKTYHVTINGRSYTTQANTPVVALKRVLDTATKAHPKGIAFKEAAGYALHIYYSEKEAP